MKAFLPLIALSLIFTSCSSRYYSGHTPDDVYFSPARPAPEYVSEDRYEDEDKDKYAYEDDRYLRMKVRNRDRWSELDDYYRDPYAYTYDGCYCKCNYNQRLYWSYYTPYPSPVYVMRPVVVNKPRISNLHVFDTEKSSVDPKLPAKTSAYNNSRNERYTPSTIDRGSELRTNRSSSSMGSSSSTSTKSSGSSSSGSSSSGSRNNGNAAPRRF